MAATDGGAERAGEIVRAGRATPTPLAVCWPSGSLVEPGMRVLREGRVPLFSTVEGCATALGAALAFARARGTAPAPGPVECREAPPAADRVDILPWAGVRALLDPAGIRLADEVVVRSVADATAAAPGLRYPVAVKVLGVAHRTEVDGVRLGITEAGGMIGAVRELLPRGEGCLVQPMVAGIEVLVGALRDPGLGPFVLVAPGGVEAELYGERAMRPAPVGPAEAARMVGECPGLDARLRGHRGAEGADRAALADVIARVSALAAGLGTRLVELDLNPVIVGQRGAVAVDARVVLARD
jgi:acyl-CoA synthetase (NDP forming)